MLKKIVITFIFLFIPFICIAETPWFVEQEIDINLDGHLDKLVPAQSVEMLTPGNAGGVFDVKIWHPETKQFIHYGKLFLHPTVFTVLSHKKTPILVRYIQSNTKQGKVVFSVIDPINRKIKNIKEFTIKPDEKDAAFFNCLFK